MDRQPFRTGIRRRRDRWLLCIGAVRESGAHIYQPKTHRFADRRCWWWNGDAARRHNAGRWTICASHSAQWPSSLFNNAVPGFDIPILDHSSKLLGFVQPYSYAEFGLADNTTVGGQWQTSGLMQIGALAQSKITLASACGGTGGTWTKNITLDSTRTLILIYGTSLHAVVYNSSTFTFGAPVLLRAVLSATGVDATVAAVLVAANSTLVHSVQDSTTTFQSVVL